MSTQRYHFLTVVGRAGRDVEETADALLATRVEDRPRGYKYTDFTKAAHVRIERLCLSLLDVADDLPVLHHATYVDGWAMGSYALRDLPSADGRERYINLMNVGLAWMPGSHAEVVLAWCARQRRRSARHDRRWWGQYADALATAFHAGAAFDVPYTVVVIAECLGCSRLDADVFETAKKPLPPKAQEQWGRTWGRDIGDEP